MAGKTISLSESAYQRLKAWKGKRDTFSTVVEKMVPPRGTWTAVSKAAAKLPSLTESQFSALEKSVEAGRHEMGEAWR
jgi:predicted CopG family antitoxin